MHKGLLYKVLILIGYCLPFSYFAMRTDFNGGLIGYALMVFGPMVLALGSQKVNSRILVIVGNVLTLTVSYFFLQEVAANGQWNGYFKPFLPEHLLIIMSVLNIVPQFLIIQWAEKRKYKADHVSFD